MKTLFFIWTFIFWKGLSAQENLIVNGDFSNNYLWITTDENKLVPMLESCPCRVYFFRGQFVYPYPDSFIYMALKVGNGLLKHKGYSYYGQSEICGKFKRRLIPEMSYQLRADYFPYWGNAMVEDSIPLYFLDSSGEILRSVNVYIGQDTPFLKKTLETNFMSNGQECFFCLRIDSTNRVKLSRRELFEDSFVTSLANQPKYKRWHQHTLSPIEHKLEKQMRIDSAFVYYLFRQFSCHQIVEDSSQICDKKLDTSLISILTIDIQNENENFEAFFLHNQNIYRENVLIRVVVDDKKDASELLDRASLLKKLLETNHECIVEIELKINDGLSPNTPKKKSRWEVMTIKSRYVNCKSQSVH